MLTIKVRKTSGGGDTTEVSIAPEATVSELKSAIGNIVDEDDIARMFKEADVDGSDTIDLKEFMEMMKTTGLWE